MGRPGKIIRPTDVHRRATVGSDERTRSARVQPPDFGIPRRSPTVAKLIVAFASTRLDRLMLVRDAREWTVCTFCTGTGTARGGSRCALCKGGVFEVLCHDSDPDESRRTAARTPASDRPANRPGIQKKKDGPT